MSDTPTPMDTAANADTVLYQGLRELADDQVIIEAKLKTLARNDIVLGAGVMFAGAGIILVFPLVGKMGQALKQISMGLDQLYRMVNGDVQVAPPPSNGNVKASPKEETPPSVIVGGYDPGERESAHLEDLPPLPADPHDGDPIT